ncbi:glycosyl hydrolase family 3 N terminal domain-containing protein [Aspergillus spectabilis]
MGTKYRRKGANVALGPVVGPVGRVARGGRNWEGFSNDPYLGGALAGETVHGLQENVIASVKHFIGNEQEIRRNPPGFASTGLKRVRNLPRTFSNLASTFFDMTLIRSCIARPSGSV